MVGWRVQGKVREWKVEMSKVVGSLKGLDEHVLHGCLEWCECIM